MNIAEFNNWLLFNGHSKKRASDTVSRLKRVEKSLIYSSQNTSIDEEFIKDECHKVLESLNKNKDIKENIFIGLDLPIDKTEISNYKTAVNKYIEYLKSKK